MSNDFLPISRADMAERGWDQCDFVYVIGDAYVDHPSFGHAIISRVLESRGYRVGIISQPDWRNPDSIAALGAPRLGFLVMGGNMDSMVCHYTVAKRRRKTDFYTPGGVMGKRPDRAVTVYCRLIRQRFPDSAILIGGLEASLRRLSHYDYWADKMLPSILVDSGADLLLYGMGERSIIECADALEGGLSVEDIHFVRGTVYRSQQLMEGVDYEILPSSETVLHSKRAYAESFRVQYQNTDPVTAKALAEPCGDGYIIQNPPQPPLSTDEMDAVYALPYTRTWHPSYAAAGGVPAIDEVRFSLTSCRGCYGACSFCALTFHQGRIIQSRSHESLLAEARQMTADPDFKGYIHDVGGPTANFRKPACAKQMTHGACKDRQCLFPYPCRNLEVDHSDYLSLLRKLRALPGVKKVFVRSGIRFDYLLCDQDESFFGELVEHHISGQLKVAPEHISESVLKRMGKPDRGVYNRFVRKYRQWNQRLGKDQYLVPYLMSSHPGSTLKEAVELAEFLRDLGYMPEQVQDFYPTPSTISTVMYCTGFDPRTMEQVYTPTDPHEKAMQRALIQYRNPKNYDIVLEALQKAGRMDLVGYGPECLIRPRKKDGAGNRSAGNTKPNHAAEKTSRTAQTPSRTVGRAPQFNAKPYSAKASRLVRDTGSDTHSTGSKKRLDSQDFRNRQPGNRSKGR